jgi:hypothetical protein
MISYLKLHGIVFDANGYLLLLKNSRVQNKLEILLFFYWLFQSGLIKHYTYQNTIREKKI